MADVNAKPAPLEDIMAAMDVVDTLRHQQQVVARELDGEGRRERLLKRLRDMYQAQGIEVPDHVLEEGIDALEQERFKYQPVAPSWKTRVAHIWVSRSRWGKPIGFLGVLAAFFYSIYFVTDVLPERRMQDDLPDQVQNSLNAIIKLAKNRDVIADATSSAKIASTAIEQGEYSKAQAIVANLQSTREQLAQTYIIRVVSRPNEQSGVWRRPPNNPDSRNYYLIVEAIDPNNEVVELLIMNEENNRAAKRKVWGLRVNEQTFQRVAQDKQDDGIIQANKVGEKPIGYLTPKFSVPTTGATITDW